MKFKSLTLQNYKPFYQKHVLDFEEEGVIFLFGAKNGRGKTAILDGIKRCLYGFSEDEERDKAINRIAATEQSEDMLLQVKFTRDDSTYTVSRQVEFTKREDEADRQADNTTVSVHIESDENEDEFIKDANSESDDYEQFIERVLPADVSEYFFFDGEKIDEYANRFGSANTNLREGIEDVLGLQEIDSAISDIRVDAISVYEDKYSSAKSDSRSYKEKKSKLTNTREETEDLQEEKEELKKEISNKEELESDIKKEISIAKDVKEHFDSKIKAEAKLKGPDNVDQAEDTLSEDVIEELQPPVNTKIRQVIQEQTEVYQNAGVATALQAADGTRSEVSVDTPSGLPSVIRDTVHGDYDDCPACGQTLEPSRPDLIDRLDDITDEATEEANRLNKLATQLPKTERGSDIQPGRLAERAANLSERLNSLKQERETLKEQIKDLEEKIDASEEPDDDIQDKQKELKNVRDEINELNSKLDKTKSGIKSNLSRIDNLESELDDLEGASDEEEYYNQLRKTAKNAKKAFEQAKEEYTIQRRKDVEDEVNTIFQNLTHDESNLQGIKIDKNYELKLELKSGHYTISDVDPSRGERQIIAYSFIAGLSKYTSRDAPLVIDTPIARLDQDHKTNLLEELPKFADQIFVLYQSNEINNENVNNLSEKEVLASHQYIIQQEDRPSASKIVDADSIDRTIEGDD